MAIDFPANPNNGQQFTSGGVTWTWDGVKWTAGASGVAYLPLVGGTMQGPIVLAADPALPLGAATKQYVDGVRHGDNRIINGDMRIDQRNAGGSGTATGVYTIDRWVYGASQASKGAWQRGGPFTTGAPGFPYQLQFTSSSAYTPLTGDAFQFYQHIEADAVSDFAWGTANAQPVTLSFWVYSSLGGTFSGAISNDNGTRAYPFAFPLAAATFTKIIITIPGDTGGTWLMSGNGRSVVVHFDLGAGATVRGPANAWASANYIGVTGAISTIATNGAIFAVTGVKLEVGSIATPFNRQSLAKSMADCQRYYYVDLCSFNVYSPAGSGVYGYVFFKTTMRAAPTIALTNITYTNSSGSGSAGITVDKAVIFAVATTAGNAAIGATITANAEL